jgi:Family of unknown function (DUF5681)
MTDEIDRDRPNGDGAVGYRRPPRHAQFKPGQCGNPRGRPKGARSIGTVLQEIMRQRISVTENGKTRRMSTLEVIFRRLANEAMRSDPKAVKLLLAVVDRYGGSPESTVRFADLQSEDLAILAQYRPGLVVPDPGPGLAPDGQVTAGDQ